MKIHAMCFLFLSASICIAQEKKADDKMMQMMAEYQKFAEPGEHHAHLKQLEGNWKLTGKSRQDPKAPWMEWKATSEVKGILEGRFHIEHVKGEANEMMPKAYEGYGIRGYDNYTKKYISVWMDNYGSSMMKETGSCAKNGKELNYEGEWSDPVLMRSRQTLSTVTFESPNKYVWSTQEMDDYGNWYENMHIVYERSK